MVHKRALLKFERELRVLSKHDSDIFTSKEVGISGKILQVMMGYGMVSQRGRSKTHVAWEVNRGHLNKMVKKISG